jgi:hypothetical protein
MRKKLICGPNTNNVIKNVNIIINNIEKTTEIHCIYLKRKETEFLINNNNNMGEKSCQYSLSKKTHHFYFFKYLTNEKRYLPQIFTIL